MRTAAWNLGLTLLLWVAVALAAAIGCSSEQSGTASNGKGGSAGSGAAAGTGGGVDIYGSTQTLALEPPTATITITSKTTPATQAFKALENGNPVAASFTLDNYDIVSIDSGGLATTTGLLSGKVVVTATYNGKTASAELLVKVDLSEDVDTNLDPGNKAALGGVPQSDPGANDSPPNPTRFLYPYDQTVMPRGLLAPLMMLSAGSLPPLDAKLKLSTPSFSWQGYYHLSDPNAPRLTVPQPIWDAALYSAQGNKLSVEVTKAVGGQAYGPYAIEILVAQGSLRGVVYYMTYEDPSTGLWAARPGDQQGATQVKSGCVVCHSVAANGSFLSTGAEVNVQSAESGVYQVDLTGNATQISQSPPGLGGDSRGLSFGTWMPDGKYVMRSQNDFWGGVNQLAWKVDAAGQKLDAATVVGLGAGVSAYLPAFSHDGKRYAFTQGHGEASPPGTEIRSINLMDVALDEAAGPFGTLTFSNRKVVLDNGPSGKVAKYATFLPDSNLIVLQESQLYDEAHGGMLATRVQSGAYGAADGKLTLIDVASSGHIELAAANSGAVPADAEKNYEPFALPIAAGGYYWVVFTSIRQYGNLQMGGSIRKQLWVAAISPTASAGADPSHPPFFLPNQTETKNERGFWALDPCKPTGDSCETGDQCCEGFCRPSDPSDPSSPKICGPGQGCSQISEKCTTDADCCVQETGVTCLGGFCSPAVPQ
jgi:hypothetical protein